MPYQVHSDVNERFSQHSPHLPNTPDAFIESVDRIAGIAGLDDHGRDDLTRIAARYPFRVTEYYASLIDRDDPCCPIRRQAVPSLDELDGSYGTADPLTEDANSPVPGLIRVYPDRVAVIITNRCPTYCRHCLRKRLTRTDAEDLRGNRRRSVMDYIRRDLSIRDVLLTGGDPLMFGDDEIDDILAELRSIGHVKIIRIGTRAPCTWPGRISEGLCAVFRKHRPIWLSTQFNHPRELTEASERALAALADSGVPVNNQSVLLKGINDSVSVMRDLVQKLVRNRVRPYYLYQAQTLAGTEHFVTSIERGFEIIRGLRGWTTGFAVPQFILDTPYGKVPLNPDYAVGREGEYFVVKNYTGKEWREYNPRGDEPDSLPDRDV